MGPEITRDMVKVQSWAGGGGRARTKGTIVHSLSHKLLKEQCIHTHLLSLTTQIQRQKPYCF